MQKSSVEQKSRSSDTSWYFLAEYPLSEFLPDQEKGIELAGECLYQTVRELGKPAEYIENIEMTLTRFAQEALAYLKTGRLELPERIRVFCQKKMIEDANPAKYSRLYEAQQAIENVQIIHPSGKKMNEGWGYYLIERGSGFEGIPCKESCRVVEIYIYDEANWR